MYVYTTGTSAASTNPWPPGYSVVDVSPYGVMDMAGNASEWVSDSYSATAYSTAYKDAPKGPNAPGAPVTRGASYASGVTAHYRASNRSYFKSAEWHIRKMGVRCAKDAKP